MPQICKCRIVNFRYNGGKRLIADELFDFGNELGNGAKNTLIDMANGIGKTVMVQLMLQPIIPNASISGRKIQTYFKNSSDHCFILLEWLKDNSNEKLLTGIAIAAGEETTTDLDSDKNMGRKIRYYTFITNYLGSADYDIAHLPLSKKENNTFMPAAYKDFIDSYKKSKRFTFYRSDENRSWKEKLSEYGILQTEWHTVMEKLNSKEGGITDFFEKFSNSNELIDKLLIKTIEERIRTNNLTGEDDSLETMLINHAKRYKEQKKNLDELKEYELARKEVTNIKDEVDEAFNVNHDYENKQKEFYGFYISLTKHHNYLINRKTELNNKLNCIFEEERQIKWEKVSAEYYESEQKYNESLNAFNDSENTLELAKRNLDNSKRDLAKIEASEYYSRKKEIETNINELQKIIDSANNNEESKTRISNLRYSIAKILNEEIPIRRNEKLQCKNKIKAISDRLAQLDKTIKELDSEKRDTKTLLDKTNGNLETLQQNNDELREKLKIKAVRMLGDTFYENELLKEKDIRIKEKEKTEESLNKAIGQYQQNNISLESKNKEITDKKIKLNALEKEAKELDRQIDVFKEKETEIKSIYDKYSSDYSKRSSKSLNNYLKDKIKESEIEKHKLNRIIETLEEQLKAASNNNLHIPQLAISFLNDNNYDFETCEKYLLNQVVIKNITQADCNSILENNPSVAYALLMNEKDRNNILNYSGEDWLPYGVPIYTYEEIGKAINGEKLENNILALYSKEYFNDPSDFIQHLNKAKNENKNSLNQLINNIESLNNTLKEINEFETLEKENEARIKEREKTKKEIESFNKKIVKLEEDVEKLKNEQSRLESEKEALKDDINSIELWLKDFDNFKAKVSEEKELNIKVDELNKSYNEYSSKLDNDKKEYQNEKDNRGKLDNKLEITIKELSEMENVFNEVKDSSNGKLIEGNWKDLYQQLKTELENIGKEIETLTDKINLYKTFANDYTDRINKISIKYSFSQEDYCNIEFSKEKLEFAENTVKLNESKVEEANQVLQKAIEDKSKCEANFNHINESLKVFNEPLPKDKIGSDFDRRLKEKAQEKYEIEKVKNETEKEYEKIDKVWNLTDSFKNEFPKQEEYFEMNIANIDLRKEFEGLKTEINKLKNNVDEYKNKLFDLLKSSGNKIKEKLPYLGEALCEQANIIRNNIEGDLFFTISSNLDNNLDVINKSISRLNTDLDDFKESEETLIRASVLKAKQIQNELRELITASKIKISEDITKHILKIDLPEVDEDIARGYISDELKKAVEEISVKLSETPDDDSIYNRAHKSVSNSRLLRRYINKDNIRLEAFKVDANPKNSTYRAWENTQVQNSGAEKFLAYFAIIVSIINYNRKKAGINDKALHSVLILDNPFGPISSAHVLDPMFEMAKKLKVQLICFSNITKADITSRFDTVIKAIVKPLAFNLELLTHEGNEEIEHGFYRRELTLFG